MFRQKEEDYFKRQDLTGFNIVLFTLQSSVSRLMSISTECPFILTWLGRTRRSAAAASPVQIRRSWWPSLGPLQPAARPSLYTDPTLPTAPRSTGGQSGDVPLTPGVWRTHRFRNINIRLHILTSLTLRQLIRMNSTFLKKNYRELKPLPVLDSLLHANHSSFLLSYYK